MRHFSASPSTVILSSFLLTSLTFSVPGSAQAPPPKQIPLFTAEVTAQERGTWKWSNIIKSAALSPGGKIAVTMSEDGVFTLWDAQTGQTLHILKAHERSSISNSPAVFSPDSRRILTVGYRSSGNMREAKLWNVETGKLLWTIKAQRGSNGYNVNLFNPVFSPDGKWLATSGIYQDVCLWDAQTGQLQRQLPSPRILLRQLAFSPDGKMLAGGGANWLNKLNGEKGRTNGEIVEWNINTGELLHHFHHLQEDLNTQIHTVAFSPDGKTLATGGINGKQSEIGFWDLQKGLQVAQLLFDGQGYPVIHLAFSPDGQRLATGGRDDVVRLYDVATRTLIGSTTQYGALEKSETIEMKRGKPGVFQQKTIAYNELGISNESRSETAGPLPTGEGALRIKTIKNVWHGKGIADLKFSSDGKTLGILAQDKQMRYWDIADLEAL